MGSRKRALIATDRRTEMVILTSLVSECDCEIVRTEDAQCIESQVKKYAPSLAIIDASMKGLDASSLLSILRSDELTKNLRILALVPYAQPALEQELLAGGADEVITSPFSGEVLAARVRDAVRRHEIEEDAANMGKMIFTMVSSFEARDISTKGHPERVARASRRLGERLGFTPKEQETLFKGGMLHDIGMLKVPKGITDKPGQLTSEEYETLKLHAVWGERMCHGVHYLHDVMPIIRHHHEQMDGHGYPDGLRGEEIPKLARVVAIIEVFDALMSDRPYRSRMPQKDAMRYLQEYASRNWLDSKFVTEFLDMVNEEGWPKVPGAGDTFVAD